MTNPFSTFPYWTNKRYIGLAFAMVFAFVSICLPAAAQNNSLTTTSENTFGVSASNYKYDEPGYMSLKATKHTRNCVRSRLSQRKSFHPASTNLLFPSCKILYWDSIG